MSPPRSGEPPEEMAALTPAEQETVRELVRQARACWVALTGSDGLLMAITKTVLESGLEEEMSEHVGYDQGAVQGGAGGGTIPGGP